MKRLYIQAGNHIVNLDRISDIRVLEEYLNLSSGQYSERMEPTGNYVVQVDHIAIYQSALEEKCADFLLKLAYAICASQPSASIVATPECKFIFRNPDGSYRIVPDEKYYHDLIAINRLTKNNITMEEAMATMPDNLETSCIA